MNSSLFTLHSSLPSLPSPATDRTLLLDTVRDMVEGLISMTGLHGSSVHVVRHVLMVIVAVLIAILAEALCRKVLLPLIMKLTSHTNAKWDDIVFNRTVLLSACHIVPAVVVWILLPLVFYQYHFVEEFIARLTAIYITVMTARLVLAFIDAFKDLDTSAKRSSAQQYFHSLCGVLKIVVVFISTVVAIGIIINRSPLSLLAGLGATSAVMMLVFKDTITGLVAGVRLTSNNMLHKGDWITFDKAGVNGVVEEMSLTTVKVRNFDNTFVTVSPTTLVQESFQNWKGMQQSGGRRVKRMVFFDFHSIRPLDAALRQQILDNKFFTAKELDASPAINISLFRRYMEKYLRTLPYVNQDMTLMVRQLEATNAGLPIEFYFFLKEKTWVEYEHQLADIMDAIYALTPLFGMKIYQQYPEQ